MKVDVYYQIVTLFVILDVELKTNNDGKNREAKNAGGRVVFSRKL